MGKFYSISLAIFAATGSFLFGYDSGVMTDVIQSPHFLKYFDTVSFSLHHLKELEDKAKGRVA